MKRLHVIGQELMIAINNRREKHGCSQAWIALKSGITAKTLSALVYGKHCPQLNTAHAIAQVLEMDMQDLFEWIEEKDFRIKKPKRTEAEKMRLFAGVK